MTTPQLHVACILERYYNLTLEATLQEYGFEGEDVNFIQHAGKTDDVSGILTGAEYEWAAQHISAWRACAANQAPMLIFQEDVCFSPACTDVLQATKKMASSAEQIGEDARVLFLGAAVPAVPSQAADLGAGGGEVMPARAVTQATAYVMWPEAARQLLELMPLDVSVTSFMSKHVEGRRISALMTSPAVIQPP
mgnify:CR=1 FL=1|jgi:GR25 family glycosyltransferase involved in LPS biosynthesis